MWGRSLRRASEESLWNLLNLLCCPGSTGIQEDELADAFDRLDSDDSGQITKANLRQLLGNQFSKELVEEMINDADFKQNGCVDFEEFKKMMIESVDKRKAETRGKSHTIAEAGVTLDSA